jgi:hypothetical protein
MIKLMTGIGVQDGVDGEFFWRYHITDHANDARQLGHPIKYSISRVRDAYEGEPNFFDIVEFWWTDRKSLDDRDAQSKHANPETFKDFERKGGLQLFRALVAEERVAAVNEPAPAALPPGVFKFMCAYELRPGVSLDEFVTRDRQHVERLAKKAGTALQRASINPVAEKLVREPGFAVANEFWFASEAAAKDYIGGDQHVVEGGVVKFRISMEEAEIFLEGRPWF